MYADKEKITAFYEPEWHATRIIRFLEVQLTNYMNVTRESFFMNRSFCPHSAEPCHAE